MTELQYNSLFNSTVNNVEWLQTVACNGFLKKGGEFRDNFQDHGKLLL